MALFMALLKGDTRIGEVQRQWIPWYRHPVRGNHAIHRVEANLRLIAPIMGEELPDPECRPHFCLEHSERKYAESFLSKNGLIDKRLIGIHPGCNEKFSYKRWEVEKYIDLVGRIYDRLEDAEVLLFAGPDEQEESDILREHYPSLVVVREDLNRVAALISHLSLMITNDSGLGHIASCFDVSIITIFSRSSRADPHKISPYTAHSHVIDFRKEPCDDEATYVMKVVNKCWSQH
jgi:heptosyltransferase-2